MKTAYLCTYVTKQAEVDDFENGCQPETRTCVMSESANISADSLSELVRKLNEAYYLEIDEVFLPEDEPITHIGYNRLEDFEGCKPTDRQKRSWEVGEEILYLADYTFSIMKREERDLVITKADFVGVKVY